MHAEPYEQIVEPISAAGYRVLVLDQRGHGQSAHDDDYSWQAFVDDLAAFWTALDLGCVDVVGHSMGGRTRRLRRAPSGSGTASCSSMNRSRPSRLRRAGILGCRRAADAAVPVGSTGLRRLCRGAFPTSTSRRAGAPGSRPSRRRWRPPVPLHARPRTPRSPDPPADEEWGCACPVLVVRAEHSELLTREGAEQVVAAFPSRRLSSCGKRAHGELETLRRRGASLAFLA